MAEFSFWPHWRQFLAVKTAKKHLRSVAEDLISNTHICRIKGCGGAGWPPPPPIIFERLKLPQQIIYRRKENLSESPNHQKYWENILVSRFYEQFSRNRRNLGHFRKFEKNFKLLEYETYHISLWSTWSGDSKYIICFAKNSNFAVFT